MAIQGASSRDHYPHIQLPFPQPAAFRTKATKAAQPPTRRRAISLATPANSSASRSAALFCSSICVAAEGGERLAAGACGVAQQHGLGGLSAWQAAAASSAHWGEGNMPACAAAFSTWMVASPRTATNAQRNSGCQGTNHKTPASYLDGRLHLVHQRLDSRVRQPRAVEVLRQRQRQTVNRAGSLQCAQARAGKRTFQAVEPAQPSYHTWFSGDAASRVAHSR